MFEISEKRVRRAGLDYWPYVDLHQHSDWDSFLNSIQPEEIFLFTKFATKLYTAATFSLNCALVFGCETSGLPQEIVSRYSDDSKLKIPMKCEAVRSLNLSNAVSIAVYEARRQLMLD